MGKNTRKGQVRKQPAKRNKKPNAQGGRPASRKSKSNDPGVKLRPLVRELDKLIKGQPLTVSLFNSLTGLVKKHGKRLNTVLKDGDTVFVVAMATGQINLVMLMLQHGANPNKILKKGRYSDCSVFYAGFLALLENPYISPQSKVRVIATTLRTARKHQSPVELNRVEHIKPNTLSTEGRRLLEMTGASVAKASKSIYWKVLKNACATVLLKAIYTNVFKRAAGCQIDLINLLLAQGANPNLSIEDKTGYPILTPLSSAVSSLMMLTSQDGETIFPIVQALLDAGADPNTRTGFFIDAGRECQFTERFMPIKQTALEAAILTQKDTALINKLRELTTDRQSHHTIQCVSALISEKCKNRELVRDLIEQLEVDAYQENKGNGEVTLFELAFKYQYNWLIHHLKEQGWNINIVTPSGGTLLHKVCSVRMQQETHTQHPVANLLEHGLQMDIPFEGKFPLEIALEKQYISGVIAMANAVDLSQPEHLIQDKNHGPISALHYIALYYSADMAQRLLHPLRMCSQLLTEDGLSAADLASLKGKLELAEQLHHNYGCPLTPQSKAILVRAHIAKDDPKGLALIDHQAMWIPVGDYAFTPKTLAILANKSACATRLKDQAEGMRYQGEPYEVPDGYTLRLYANSSSFSVRLKAEDVEEEVTVYEPPFLMTTSAPVSGRAYCEQHGLPFFEAEPADAAAPAVVAEASAPMTWLPSPDADAENRIRPMRNSDLPCFLYIDRNAVSDCPLIAEFEKVEAKFDHNHIKTLADSGLIVLVDGQPHPITHEIKLVGQKARLLCYSINEDGKTLLVAAIYARRGLHTTADKASLSASLAAKELTQPQFAEAAASPTYEYSKA